MSHRSFIKVQRSKKSFLCALCSSSRQMRYTKNLSIFHYVQILILSGTVSFLTWSSIGAKSLLFSFVIWLSFEITNKLFYRKDIACPYCGFDATWYKRDVRVARSRVKEFQLLQEELKFRDMTKTQKEELEDISQ